MAKSAAISGWLERLLRLGVGGVFVYAGILKSLDPFQFVLDIQTFRLVPYPVSVVLALYLPWIEISAGVLLALRKLYAGALAILLVALAVFSLAILSAWFRGIPITCGCFGGPSSQATYGGLMFRDAMLLAAVILLAVRDWGRQPRETFA